jgi:CYTH domain-containing protein
VEIERKFLVADGAPALDASHSKSLRQGYLIVADAGEARVRDADGSYTLTVKTGSGLVRGEYEIELSAEQFEALWPATEAQRVEKRRYRLAVGEYTAELDVYAGTLDGLMTVEVEFPSVEAAHAFSVPAWFGSEVTGVAGYSNAELAQRGLPGLEEVL